MPALQLTTLVGANIGRLLFIYYVLQLSNTPLLLAFSISMISLMTSGAKLWRSFEEDSRASIELIICHAIDAIAYFMSLSKVNPTSYVIITLLVFCFNNIFSSRSRSRIGTLFFGIIGAIVFCFGTQISIEELTICLLSNLITLHAQKLSRSAAICHGRNSTTNHDLNEFCSAIIVACLTVLTSSDERRLFETSVTPDNTLVALWILGTLAQWICKRNERQNTSQLADMIVYTSTAIVTSLTTLDETQLLVALVTLVMLLIAAFCSISSSSSDDQLSIGETERHKQEGHKRHNTTRSYWTIGLIVIACTIVLSMHVNGFNTWEARPANPVTNIDMVTNVNEKMDVRPAKLNMAVDFSDRTMPAAQRNMYRLRCLQKTRAAYIELVTPHFVPSQNYSVMDYPNHWNLGDAFIYVGQNIMFSIYGQPPVRPPFPHTGLTAIKSSLGVIFLTGGGNFGDLYSSADNFRTRVVNSFKKTPLVMLPQSVHYKDAKRLAQMVKQYKHDNITMMVRDLESQKFVRGNFTYADAPYVPDSAFMIGAQLPNSDPVVDIMFLLRNDIEGAVNYTSNNPKILAQQHGLTSEKWDFPIHDFPVLQLKNKTVIYDMHDIYPGRYQTYHLRPSTESLTWYRTQMGNTMLSRGRVVVADRMHATIMATLIGRPVVYIDNSYRKTSRVRSSLSAFIPECTDAMLDAYYAPNISVAVKIAADLIKKMNSIQLEDKQSVQ